MSIMEITGKTIQEYNGPLGQKSQIDISELPAGVYLLKLVGNSESIIRFVKK
jgi:hypothetical protein